MTYRNDPDLQFLEDVASSDLEPLVSVLTEGKYGTKRLTEDLTTHERYVRSYPDHHEYWDLIAAEIQCFGGNTFATMLRGGEGVLYREVLTDACDKMKVNYNDSSAVERIELNLLMKVLEDAMAEMSEEQLKEVCDQLGIAPKGYRYTAEAIILALQIMIRKGGFIAYKIAVIVANAVAKALIGRGLPLVANAALTRTMAIFAGPIGWVLSSLWLLLDIAGPAYRVTIPSVMMVAYLRQNAIRLEEQNTE